MNSRWCEPLPLQDLIPNFPWDDYKESEGLTPLHEIVCRISGRDLDNAVQIHSTDINKLDREGRSPLQLAVRNGNISAVRTLLKRGADPDIPDGMPLREAFDCGNDEMLVLVELLLRSGATVHDSGRDYIAKEWVECNEFSFWNANPGVFAVDKLLAEHNVNLNHQNDQRQGRTLLIALCIGSFCDGTNSPKDRIEQLICLGVDLELRDYRGWNALHYAMWRNAFEIMRVLVHAGARLDVKTNRGDTIAHFAVIYSSRWRRDDFVEALSEMDLSKLDLDTKNEDGHTAYDLLRKRNGLRWENYCDQLPYLGYYNSLHIIQRFPEEEYRIILALEAFLHRIQDAHGVPKDQQYPPLGEYLSDDNDEDPVPGAWPV